MNEEQQRNKELATYFYDKKVKVHISKTNRFFYNGFITYMGTDFFIIDDLVEGEKMILISELAFPIEEFREKEDKNEKEM